MERGKKIAVIAALIVVIAGAVWFLIAKFRSVPEAPDIITGMKITKVDTKTLEPKVLTMKQWEALGQRDNLYKNPDTGEYTMAPAIRCKSCGELIPEPREPADWYKGIDMDDENSEPAAVARAEEWERSVKCPRCGKNPF